MPEPSSRSAKTDKHDQSATDGNVKETIESILVAFILAFIFRAFVVEAFVIPTGSMGPTLMGAHMRFTCPDCGYHYEVNVSTPDENNIPAYTTRDQMYHCPNCGYPYPRSPMARDEPVYFGDRILVLKYRYLFSDPDPWDVVVFKSPFEKARDPEDPKYVDNYIKRLVGNPNEAIMILDGDIYWTDDPDKSKTLDRTKFKIRRKPRHVQDALWRVVNDNDFMPHLENPNDPSQPADTWRQPWLADSGSGWIGPRTAQSNPRMRILRFDNPSGAGSFGFDPNANPDMHALTEWLAYDDGDRARTTQSVADLKLSCTYTRASGDGPLRLLLTKRDDCFIAEFTPGKVTLSRRKFAQSSPIELGDSVWQKPLEAQVPELSGRGPVRIELINVDYRVSVRVNGHDVIVTDDQQYSPDIAALLRDFERARYSATRPQVRIEAAQQTCQIEHLGLWRDIYYLNNGQHYDENGPPPLGRPSNEPFWGTPDNIMRLGPDEYFVLGDNSEVSLDARFWGAPVNLPREGNYHAAPGRVPGRFLLGKAFFVYWPAGYRPAAIPYGIEPDFGDMRFIH